MIIFFFFSFLPGFRIHIQEKVPNPTGSGFPRCSQKQSGQHKYQYLETAWLKMHDIVIIFKHFLSQRFLSIEIPLIFMLPALTLIVLTLPTPCKYIMYSFTILLFIFNIGIVDCWGGVSGKQEAGAENYFYKNILYSVQSGSHTECPITKRPNH